MAQQLLDLSTLEQPTISIDKRDYPVMRPDDLGLREMLTFQRLQEVVSRVQALTLEQLTDAAIEEMAGALDTMVRTLMPTLPPEVFIKLHDAQKLQIVQAFTRLVGPSGAARPKAASPSTGANGSPD